MKDKRQFRDIYMDGSVLETKINFHARYSSVPIDLHAAIMVRCGAPNDVDLLDIGCGTGDLIEHLSRAGHKGRLFGLDLVRPLIADTPRKRYAAGDAEYLPFPDDSFDVITCIHTLSHIADIPATMSEARRALRDQGTYIATANSLHAYPHAAGYRQRIHADFGWGLPGFTTSRVNAENLEQTLAAYWESVIVDSLVGELRIPVDEYPNYFAANIPIWDHTPTTIEQAKIFRQVAEWAHEDQRDGYIIEPKRVALAVASTTVLTSDRAPVPSSAPTAHRARPDRPQPAA